jgi:hypothetical protein
MELVERNVGPARAFNIRPCQLISYDTSISHRQKLSQPVPCPRWRPCSGLDGTRSTLVSPAYPLPIQKASPPDAQQPIADSTRVIQQLYKRMQESSAVVTNVLGAPENLG